MGRYPIIVEGPDGGGKTTLARRVEQDYNRKYTRPEQALLSSTEGPGEGLVEWWDHQLAQGDRYLAHRIFDRCFYISDPIYQQAQYDRDLLVPGDQLARGIHRLWNVEPIIIFCIPPTSIQLANVRQSGRSQLRNVTDEALEKISNQYWAYWAMWSNALYDSILLYDYTEDDAYDRLTVTLETVMAVKA